MGKDLMQGCPFVNTWGTRGKYILKHNAKFTD